jgi:uncharacterized protein YecT (DUF1311 family)
MNISAPRRDESKMDELDERTQRAWTAYRDSLRDLSGSDYDEAEHRQWERLQRKLAEVEDERTALRTGRADSTTR